MTCDLFEKETISGLMWYKERRISTLIKYIDKTEPLGHLQLIFVTIFFSVEPLQA